MIKLLISLLLFFNIHCQTVKFPVYVGIGYDLAFGNPKTDQLDRGFRANVFDMTYTDEQTTEDGKFLIPDKMHSRDRRSCAYTASVSEYTGSTQYQKDLNALVEVSATATVWFVDVSFSTSVEFQQMEDTTEEKQSIVTDSKAACEAYSLEIDLYDSPNLSKGFKKAIMKAINDSSVWYNIIELYGTHFIRRGIFGGRMHLQNTIEKTKFQRLTSIGIDVKVTAGLDFGKFSGDMNSEWKKHEKEVNAFENSLEKTKEIYIGGKPPKSGNWMDWYDEVLIAPMPTSYSVNSLAELITSDKFPELSNSELDILKIQFNEALRSYCDKIGCKKPGGDLPFPNNATAVKKLTDMFITFDMIVPPEGVNTNFVDNLAPNPFMTLNKIKISEKIYFNEITGYTGVMFAGIQFVLTDTVTTYFTPFHGAKVNVTAWPENGLDDGERIAQVDFFSYGMYGIWGIQFFTNRGQISPIFGYKGENSKRLDIDGDIIGANGYYDSKFITFGFVTMTVKYN